MMSFKQWLILWFIFVGYLFFGAFLFYSIERRYEEFRKVDEKPVEKLDIEDLLTTYYTWSNKRAHQQLLIRLKQRCNVTVSSQTLPPDDVVDMEEEFQWTFYNSFFFALTTLSTIGYGNLHPTSCLGRMLVIVYSLVGIPLNGIVLTQLGEFFASTFLRAHQRYKGKRYESRIVLLIDIITYLTPGVLLFIFLPSGIFAYFEGWTFEQSVYFAFVTLTTIGYGDLVAGQFTKDDWYGIYKIVLLFWIMFGLGYLVMILGFISRAMRSKKMATLEQKLTRNLKQTHSKILNEFSRDVTYARRLLSELYLLKFKPVYQDEKSIQDQQVLKRSQSAPNLSEWPVLQKRVKPQVQSSSEDEEETRMQFEKQRMKRRKALSENLFKHSALRVHSDTDLTKIDKDATFSNVADVERNELLARVADAYQTTYSGLPSTESSEFSDSDEERPSSKTRKVSRFEKELKGIDGFTSEEILSNEWMDNDWEIVKNEQPPIYSEQWTWPGPGADQNKMSGLKRDQKLLVVSPDYPAKRRSLQLPGVRSIRRMSVAAYNFFAPSRQPSRSGLKDDDQKDAEFGVPMKESREKQSRTGGHRKHHKKRYSICDVEYEDILNRFTQSRRKEANIFAALKNQIGHLERTVGVGPVLEHTSISDFLLIVNSLSANAASDHKKEPSPLFTLFQNDGNRLERPQPTGRRYSLAVPKRQTDRLGRNRSFSTNVKFSTPMPAAKTRTNSVSSYSNKPQSRRFRSESVCSVRVDQTRLEPPPTTVQSRRIRRFSVKPVLSNAPMPEIVISGPSPDVNQQRHPPRFKKHETSK